MAIPANLQQFKSSGVYRLEFDKSQTVDIPSETIRLVVGFSKKGPFNTPMFVPNSEFFIDVFGDIDRAMERKGSFFHRSALTCLTRGPIIVLNLLSLDSSDSSQFVSLSTSVDSSNKTIDSMPLKDNYNTDKFWYLDAEEVLKNVKTVYPIPNLLNFVNVGKKKVSVLVKKSDVTGFDITAKEWYGVGNVPEFMHEYDYISDYLIDVTIVEGDFSDYAQLQNDPVFGSYFDSNGLKKVYTDSFGTERDGLEAFLNLAEVRSIGKYTGSLIPDFQDKSSTNLFIEDLINIESSVTGIMCSVNKDEFDDGYVSGDEIDLIGHKVESEDVSSINFLSYYGDIKGTRFYSKKTIGASDQSVYASNTEGATVQALLTASSALSSAAGYTAGTHFDTIKIYGPLNTDVIGGTVDTVFGSTSAFTNFADSIIVNKSFVECTVEGTTGATYTYARVASKVQTSSDVTLKIELVDQLGILNGATSFMYLTGATAITIRPDVEFFDDEDDGSGNTLLVASEDHALYSDWSTGIITNGDTGLVGATSPYKSLKFAGATFTNVGSVDSNQTGNFSHSVKYLTVTAYDDSQLTTLYTGGFVASATGATIQTLSGSLNETFSILDHTLDADNQVRLDNTSGSLTGKFLVNDYLVSTLADATTGKSRLTRITNISENASTKVLTITTADTINIVGGATGTIERYKPIENFVSNYRFSTLSGYTIPASKMPDGTNSRQNEILNVLYSTNLSNGLADREMISFRYIIDTFNNGIESGSKSKLSNLAKNRQNAFAILNMPSVKNFRESTDPIFKASASGDFDPAYIKTGGNIALNPSVIYSLPSITDGANYCAFYGPNLTLRVKGKNISVPPAAYISNLYIDKFTSALPWSIIAGPRRGIVTGDSVVGVEYQFDRDDLNEIEPFGYNSIIPKRGFGLMINSNQSAQQGVKSALSQAHVRELLIYIQDGIEAILKTYTWEFNTPQNRLEIKTLADSFMNQVLNDNGVFDFENRMDSTNNTNEIIEANMGILDTYVEPVQGMGILVHRTTILRTGEISSGNFS